MIFREGLTYDDVLLVPKKTNLATRDDADVSTMLSRNIKLNIPFVSANMDTVTESTMAIAMALEGGIGIIHRFLSIEDQVSKVLRVKRSQNIIIDNPHTLTPNKTLGEAKALMDLHGIKGLLIVEPTGSLAGILTNRDMQFEKDDLKKVSELMTKRAELVTAPFGIALDDAKKILSQNKIEKLPLVDEDFNLKGLITSKDLTKTEDNPNAAKDKKGRLRVGAAIGVKDGFLERTEALLQAGADILVIDIAHGHSEQTIQTLKSIKENFGNVEIIAGNVATSDGAKELIEAGADAIKVGVGPGAVCSTRIVAGAGVPQLTAIIDAVSIAKEYNVPVIADGGIQKSGDVTKAIGAGACTVMIGSLFAGTDESPGIAINKNGRKYKFFRGMASFDASVKRQAKETELKDWKPIDKIIPEGVESLVPYKGNVKELLHQLLGGLKSGMSYCGARAISELQKNAEFIRITNAGLKESHPHDVELIDNN